ncbi:hypothetical protein QCA50_016749 [Cerrena zonata]|uniref:Uncharacterized protein n=1 Tax=Cerrena zonata TaxID=2478898 RepID=A0AAW0FMG7_9APHY
MRDSPSTDAKISNYVHIQKESRKDAVFNNRPIKFSCPPIGMYHPVFAKFCAKMAEPLENFDFDSDELCQAACLFMVANEIYECKNDRRHAYASLQKIWRKDMRHHEKILYHIEGTPMIMTPDRYSKVTCPLLPNGSFGILSFEEMENELGTGHSDPLTRAECDYVAMVTSDELLHTRQSSCCPTLLLGWAGPYLTVSGAVFTDKLITQRLTPDYIYLGPRPSTTRWTSFDHGVHKLRKSFGSSNRVSMNSANSTST